MSFQSILFNEPSDRINANNADTPPFFVDLNLDQIVDAITAKWAEYDLKNFFYFPLSNIDAIHYRHEVFKELENLPLYESLKLFSEEMSEVRNYIKLVEKLYYQNQKNIWILYAAEHYCSLVRKIANYLSSVSLKSCGFIDFSEYLKNYTADKQFISLENEINDLKIELSKVRYRIIIQDNSFTVQNHEPGIDYSAEIETTFEKFKQGAVKNYKVAYKSSSDDMNHIEAQILDFVAKLNSALFLKLDNFYVRYAKLPTGQAGFINEIIAIFDREIHFYIAYVEHIKNIKDNGIRLTEDKLQFCYPKISDTSKEVYNFEGFDLALAQKLSENKGQIVCNDFYLKDKERIIVVTGPNQGGKTTFARTFGQLHYLSSIGCAVPGREAQLFFFDQIFTQFERAEKVENLRGKLEDDLVRVHYILDHATSRTVIIMNEIFNSTTLQDVSYLSTKIMEEILKHDLLCVWVTFIDELAAFSEQTISMTSTIVPGNPALRTFKVIRRPADGLAFALAIAEKYQLTYRHIKERIKS